jgi:predicted negative regulator of RcsB-dependent stress response
VAVLAWIEVNKKRLALGAVALLFLLLLAGIVVHRQTTREIKASEALSVVPVPFNPAQAAPPGTADALLKVANDFKGTRSAARALVVSAGMLFAEKNYAEAQARFLRIGTEYPDSEWAPQAALGVAASLAAQGKAAEATSKYEEVRRRHGNSPIADEAKLAVARLYEAQKPEEAFKLYDELIKAHQYSGLGAEAGIRRQDLLGKHPELEPPKPTPAPPTPIAQPVVQATSQVARLNTNRPTTINLSNLVRRTTGAPPVITITNQAGPGRVINLQPTTPTPGAPNPPASATSGSIPAPVQPAAPATPPAPGTTPTPKP